MSRFSIKYPYFIFVSCLIVCIMGIVSLIRMPVDLFPKIKIPVVVVATFYSGMPPEDIETSITARFERFFTLGSGIDYMESRSLSGVSLIKIYFQPGTDADSAVTSISNLAMADLKQLPPGTLPPVVLKFDASSLPVCLVALKADNLTESALRDLGQYNIRNQLANIQGASVPQPFGGRYRQIMIYVDPLKLEAHQLSVMDVVRVVNNSNLILPAGDVLLGPYDYSLFSNSQLDTIEEMNQMPLKVVNGSFVTIGDVGYAKDAAQIQTNIVFVDGRPSVYLPILKQGGDSNTISIVNDVKRAVKNLLDVPKELITSVVFDQSIFVKNAIENLIHEGSIGLGLTALMIFIFLGSLRATLGVFFSIPLSVLATFSILALGDNSINSMILGGLALAFSRLIDNSVVVLENIHRHLELGQSPEIAAEEGGKEVSLPVLAATLTTAIVFFPVTMLYGVSQYLFCALALSVIISLFASYIVAMTVVPLYSALFFKPHEHNNSKDKNTHSSLTTRFNKWFNEHFLHLLQIYDRVVQYILQKPKLTLQIFTLIFASSLAIIPFLDLSYFPRTDPGQFVINLKASTGLRVELTAEEVKKVEDIVRRIVSNGDLELIASNIGTTPDFSAIYTSNTASHTAFVQVSLKEKHKVGSYEYMGIVRKALEEELPHLTTYFQTGGLIDAVLNLGLPAPINIQVSSNNLEKNYEIACELAGKIKNVPEVSDVFIPEDIDAPALMLTIDRKHASEVGLNQKEVISNIITALTSNQMIAPNYWVDPISGYDYLLTVQYPENIVKTLEDLKAVPLRASKKTKSIRFDALTSIASTKSPTVVSHYQLRRVINLYVSTKQEDLGRASKQIDSIIKKISIPDDIRVTVRGSVEAMNTSFKSFGFGFLLAILLVYLVLVAQFKSFIDPFIILLAVPPGIIGVLLMLSVTGTSLNIMSLMGIVMLIGIAVSNSILIVEFTHHLLKETTDLKSAISMACQVRLRPVLMTSLATIIGLIPMALALGAGSEAYAPLARVIIGGLTLSVLLTVFLVPAAYYLIYNPSNSIRSTS